MDPREREFEKALRKLAPVFQRKLAAKDVRHDLYGKEQLTWNEYERIGVARTDGEAADELMKALRRKHSTVLDILVECLKEQEDANADIIRRIREVFPEQPSSVPTQPVSTDTSPLTSIEDWPAPVASPSTSHPTIPPPPVEGTDAGRKDAYKMSSKPRGMALIVNNRKFTCGMKERIGTDKDAENLHRLFEWLGFSTKRKDDLTGKAMKKEFVDLSSRDHTQYDCVVVALLTHGISGRLYSTDGDLIPIEDITKYFDGNNCPSLIGKPKVFILQACRGGKFDYGVESDAVDGPAPPDTDDDDKFDKVVEKVLDEDETDGGGYSKEALPTEADFILAYATVPGYVSWRNSEYGSWFIKAFVDTMKELAAKEHFVDILTEVNRKVAFDFQSRGRNKQIPAPVTMLTRKLYFRPTGR